MARKRIMSFYDFMMEFYLIDPDRYALANNMRRLSKRHPELKQINSLADLMIATSILTDPDAKAAVTGNLWCEYCAKTGHPVSDTQTIHKETFSR